MGRCGSGGGAGQRVGGSVPNSSCLHAEVSLSKRLKLLADSSATIRGSECESVWVMERLIMKGLGMKRVQKIQFI